MVKKQKMISKDLYERDLSDVFDQVILPMLGGAAILIMILAEGKIKTLSFLGVWILFVCFLNKRIGYI